MRRIVAETACWWRELVGKRIRNSREEASMHREDDVKMTRGQVRSVPGA